MVLNTTIKYFFHWKITTSNYQFISVVDLKQQKSYIFQGDEANPLLTKFDELGIDKFLEWFYTNEFDLSMDHANYELTKIEIQYMKEFKDDK